MAKKQLDDVKQLIDEIEKHLGDDNFAEVSHRINVLRPADAIRVLERLNHRHRAFVYLMFDKDLALRVFEGLPPVLQGDLVNALQEHDTAELFIGLAPDDRVWLLDELPATVASKLLEGLDVDERAQTSALLGYAEGSIGRRMSPQFITLRPYNTVADAMQRVNSRLHTA
ncbi:MAG TPA: magnesium transporter, partial [Candidatus Yaniella excrementavium]|nr:magnesium transporter [Candidatus Yaniella excrementavium]